MPGYIRYITTMDNRSFIRGAAQNASAVRDSNKVIRGENDETEASIEELNRATEKTRGAVSGFAGALGLGGLAFGLKDAVQGGEQLQVAQSQLQSALKATGQATKNTYDQLTEASEKASESGGFAPEQQLESITALVRATHSSTSALKLNALATNIARSTGNALAQTTTTVSRAYAGSTRGLQQLIGPLVQTESAEYKLTKAHALEIDKLQDAAQMAGKSSEAWLRYQTTIRALTPQQRELAELQDKTATGAQTLAIATKLFSGSTAAYAATSAGKINDLHRSLQNLVDTTGEAFLPAVNKAVGVLDKFAGWLDRNRAVMFAFIGSIAAVSTILVAHAAVVELVKAKTILLTMSNKLLGTSFKNSEGEILGQTRAQKAAAAAAARTAASNDTLAASSDAAAGSTEALAGAEDAAAVSSGILASAMDLIPIVAIAAGLILLTMHFGLVEKAAVSAFHWIEGAAQSVWTWIKQNWPILAGVLFGPIGYGIAEGVKHFKQIEGAVSSAVKWIDGAWHKLLGILEWPFIHAWDKIKSIAKDISHVFGSIAHTAGSILHTASFGLFHSGGPVRPVYRAMGGPSGTDTVPAWLTPGEYVLNRSVASTIGTSALGQLNSGNLGALGGGGMGNATITPSDVYIKIDSRTIAKAVVNYTLRQAARGPSSLVGGSLATGATSTGPMQASISSAS